MKGFLGYGLMGFGLYGSISLLSKNNFNLDWITFLLMFIFGIGLHIVISDQIDDRIGKH